ncbi:hypothetical protein B566_EDAN006843 [Ephemera danica]|nr:hypothetical protein B566_EDAN006843 [Ephemera danica]
MISRSRILTSSAMPANVATDASTLVVATSDDESFSELAVGMCDLGSSPYSEARRHLFLNSDDNSSRASSPDEESSSLWFASLPDRERHEQFLQEASRIMLDEAVFTATNRNESKVLEWHDPDELSRLLDLRVRQEPSSHDELLNLIRGVIRYSVKTGHPRFINQLFSSVYTYEVAPVFTLMEETVLKEMRTIVGFPNGDGDGIFCPGGSMANGYGISCARYHKFPQVKTAGLHGLPRLVVLTSEDAHYSVQKMASLFGLGADNVYAVQCDERGKMRPDDLENQILRARSEGAQPYMVLATEGTTVLGAFDPLPEIADLCEKYGLWLHVDAAWGGGALMSQNYRHRLNGIQRADSVTWNPHKLLAAPQQCSVFLTRHKQVLASAHSASATYLFQQDKFYDTSLDTGDKHVQCGRRADVLKFWLMWKAKGTQGLTAHIETVFDRAEYFTSQIAARDDFRLVLNEPECTNVCFWYLPPSLRDCDPTQKGYNERLHKVAPKIKERMMKEGSMMVTYQPLRQLPNFFRLVVQSSGVTRQDMDFFLQEIVRLGSDL